MVSVKMFCGLVAAKSAFCEKNISYQIDPAYQRGRPLSTRRGRRPAKRKSTFCDPVRQPVGVRIIGGRLRGRKLRYIGQWLTRPMKDRVRQALFNILGPAVEGKWAVDLFAGTGALGIEALSRGASRATFIEQHVPTAETIRQNLAELGLQDHSEVLSCSALVWAQHLCSVPSTAEQTSTPWLVFCSPPWDYFVFRRDQMLALLKGLIDAAPADSVFVGEWDQRFDHRSLPYCQHWDIRFYLPAIIGIYLKQGTREFT